MITAYEMTTKELTARLEALADHQHTELLGREVNNIWRQVCREAAARLRSTEANDEAFNDGIEAAATYIAGLDNPWREGGDTLGMADDIRALKRQSAGEGKYSPSDKHSEER